MKITLKSLISLCLSVLLLISTVSCVSPIEPSAGNDTTAGTTEETTIEEITEDHFETSEEIVTTEIKLPNEDLYPLLNKNHDNTEFWDLYYSEQHILLPYFQVYQPWSFLTGIPPTIDPYNYSGAKVFGTWMELSPGVYTNKRTYNLGLLDESVPNDAYILCEIQFKEIIEAYASAKEAYRATEEGKNDDWLPSNLRPDFSGEEGVALVEQYRETLLENGVIFYYGGYIFNDWGLFCMMTKEQILNFKLSEENLQNGQYVVVAPSDVPR